MQKCSTKMRESRQLAPAKTYFSFKDMPASPTEKLYNDRKCNMQLFYTIFWRKKKYFFGQATALYQVLIPPKCCRWSCFILLIMVHTNMEKQNITNSNGYSLEQWRIKGKTLHKKKKGQPSLYRERKSPSGDVKTGPSGNPFPSCNYQKHKRWSQINGWGEKGNEYFI